MTPPEDQKNNGRLFTARPKPKRMRHIPTPPPAPPSPRGKVEPEVLDTPAPTRRTASGS